MPRTPADLPDPREDLWASLVALLRLLRRLNGMSQEQTAEICGVERQTVGAWEKGRNRIGAAHCRKLDNAWNTGGVLEANHHYAEIYEGGPVVGDYIADERTAKVVRMVTNNVIPALFQTTEYTRGLYMARGNPAVDEEVPKWLARQAIIKGSNAPSITAIIDQTAFDHPPAEAIMPAQIEKLIDLSRLPNVRIRVIERKTPWHIGLEGDLTIFTVNSTRRTYISGQLGTRAITGATSADRLESRWEQISEAALTSDQTINLLHAIKKDTK